ncbi:HNH endonuclease [Marinobacter sp. BW6]|uniref:HNH endonuclease n=1 Tax=Marinobacter sp. BW6 TaxID=2592624 RepID=UPI0011DE6537|nr:HNH endonuclease [Marinobacter sp. BW6]TYC63823.1 HNH endonuclease [Marinobacter sp. BW6]
MKLHFPVEQLWAQVRKMGAAERPYTLNISLPDPLPDIVNRFNEGGAEIELKDVETTGGLLSSNGAQIVLYIPDQGQNIDSVLENGHEGKKVHVADCQTLEQMRQRNRFQRYRAVVNTSGDFEVFGYSKNTFSSREGSARLRVCINCLKHLNYRGYVSTPARQREILSQFDLKNFFAHYSSLFRYLPKSFIEDKGGYAENWKEVSARYRESKEYICESCGVDLKQAKALLHTHHIDGNKRNNNEANLQALCADCHRKQPLHDHMYIKQRDMLIIQQFRKAQNIIGASTSWDELFGLVDSAFEGLLRLYQQQGSAKPEIGYEITGADGAVVAESEIAWPSAEFAVVGNATEKNNLESMGWRAVTLEEALREFRDRK